MDKKRYPLLKYITDTLMEEEASLTYSTNPEDQERLDYFRVWVKEIAPRICAAYNLEN